MDLEIRALRRPDEIDQLVELLDASYVDESAEKWAEVQANLDVDPRYTRVGLVEGRMVTTVQIFTADIRLDGQALPVGGIAHVGTRPDAGGSFAARLLDDAVAIMRDEGYQMSMLYTGIPRYYNRYGWWTIPECVFTVELGDEPPSPAGACRIDTCDKTRDLPALAELHERVCAGVNGTKVRTDKDWRIGSPWEPDDPDRYLVARDDDRVVGYIRSRAGSLDVISELVYDDVDAACDLVLTTLLRAVAGGVRRVSGKFPLDAALAARLRDSGLTVASRVDTTFDQFEVTMLRFLDVPGFFTSIQDRLARRLAEQGAGPDAAVALKCRSGLVGFGVKGGQLTVSDAPGPDAPVVKVKDAQLLELTVGAKTAAEVDAFAELPDATRALLAGLFPGRPVTFWLPDHF